MHELVESTLWATCATITCIEIESVCKLRDYLAERGYHVLIADLRDVEDEVDIFLSVVAKFSFGESYMRYHKGINMTSLDDLLIDELRKYPKIALLVTNAENLVERHLNLAFNLFVVFAHQTHRMKALGFPALMTTLLIGNGPNFKSKIPEDKNQKVESLKRPIVRNRAEIKHQRESR